MTDSNSDPLHLLETVTELMRAYEMPGAPEPPPGGATRVEYSPCAEATIAAAAAAVEKTLLACREYSARPRELADLRLVMCTACAEIRAYALDHGCRVRLELPAEPLLVHANASHLEIALLNLVRNAIDAAATAVTLLGGADNERVEVRVDDNGDHAAPCSASPDEMTACAWPADIAGSIARSIVEDYGGRLDLVAHPGRGTTACLILPRETDGVAS